jgi:hypothetical protein
VWVIGARVVALFASVALGWRFEAALGLGAIWQGGRGRIVAVAVLLAAVWCLNLLRAVRGPAGRVMGPASGKDLPPVEANG